MVGAFLELEVGHRMVGGHFDGDRDGVAILICPFVTAPILRTLCYS